MAAVLGLVSCSNDDDSEMMTGGLVSTSGVASRKGGILVNWVQLWEGGPKWAEYNVGAANNKAKGYGYYFTWDDSEDNSRIWGENWRLPTIDEFRALLDKCDSQWTTIEGVNGRLFTGRGNYANNSIFLPAGGSNPGSYDFGDIGRYWSSSLYDWGIPGGAGKYPCYLSFQSTDQFVYFDSEGYQNPVREVLAE